MRFLALFSALVSVIYGTSVCVNQNCAPKNLVADFVFLIDVSEALSQNDFNAVQQLLLNMSTSLTIGPTASQMAIYTYATRVRSAGLLKDLNTLSALQQAIGNLQYDATEDRVLQQAISQEETDVTAANGFRVNAKKVLVIIEGDEFTGQSPFNRQLDTVRAKFDMILVVGVGEQAIRNNYENTKKLAGDKLMFSGLTTPTILPTLSSGFRTMLAHIYSNSHVTPTTPIPTVVPTPNPSVPCPVTTPNFDVYLIVDTSTSITPADFSTLKQQILSFVSVYPLGDSNLNFGLVTISLDAQLYYTGFHANQNRKQLLSTLGYLTQDASNGQTLLLALRAINSTFLVQNYPTPNKLVVYLSGNTNFDQDPTAQAQSIASTYGVHFVAVKWNAGADATKLSTLTGGANCVFDATTKRDQTATWLQTQLCTKQFCR